MSIQPTVPPVRSRSGPPFKCVLLTTSLPWRLRLLTRACPMNRTATYHRRRRHPTSPLYLLGHAVHTHPVCSLLTIGLSCSDSIKVQAHPLMTKASPLHDKLWGLGRKTGSADTIRQVVKSSSAGRDVRCVLCCVYAVFVSLCVCVCCVCVLCRHGRGHPLFAPDAPGCICVCVCGVRVLQVSSLGSLPVVCCPVAKRRKRRGGGQLQLYIAGPVPSRL